MIIYIDLVFIENLIINLFFLHITAQTVKIDVKYKRLILAATLGAIYVVILLYYKIHFLSSLGAKIIIAFVMIVVAYGKRDILILIKTLIIFIFYSMVLAGLCLFLQLNDKGVYEIENVNLVNFSYKKLFLSVMIVYMFINRIVIYVRDRKVIKNLVYSVEIVTENYNKTIKAFLDTGNELREPITNLPVLIVEKAELPYDLCKDNKIYIPYKYVNGECGRLEAFKPLCVNIYTSEYKKEKKQVVIALCEGKLSKENDYNGLLSRGIFQ